MASDFSKIIREKASEGEEPSSSVTNVCTDDAHTPPALVTRVANKANPPAIKPPPIQASLDARPGLVLRCTKPTSANHGNKEPVSTGSQAQYPPQSRIR